MLELYWGMFAYLWIKKKFTYKRGENSNFPVCKYNGHCMHPSSVYVHVLLGLSSTGLLQHCQLCSQKPSVGTQSSSLSRVLVRQWENQADL